MLELNVDNGRLHLSNGFVRLGADVLNIFVNALRSVGENGQGRYRSQEAEGRKSEGQLEQHGITPWIVWMSVRQI